MSELKASRYTVKDACQALGLSRNGYYGSLRVKRVRRVSEGVLKDLDLLERIKAIKTGYPCLRQAGLLGVSAGEGMVGASGEDPGQ